MKPEAETLEEIDESNSADAKRKTEGNSAILEIPSLKHLVESYEKTPFPFAILDESQFVIYRNPLFQEILGKFHLPATGTFPSIFFRSVGEKTSRMIYSGLSAKENRRSWKGIISLKSRETVSLSFRASVFPLYLKEFRHDRPMAFTVLFDDLTDDRQILLRGMFLSLLEASKMKDNDTGLHIERVNLYSQRLSEELYGNPEWPEVDMDFMNDIGFLAAMHDVGKIGTPDDILNKQGPLEDWEWNIMMEHTKNGAYILSTYPNPMARAIAVSHHEKWNGKGYPFNLVGNMIPLAARIVTIADVYDAMRMKRSYKPAYDHAQTMEKIVEWKGVNFDPALVDCVLTIEDEFEKIYETNQDKEQVHSQDQEHKPRE